MHNIAICIPTYKRPVMLKNLIYSIFACNFNPELIDDITLIVVDNDIDRSAEFVIKEINSALNSSYSVKYFNHPEKGISNVRNELLRKAFLLESEFIVFIDDDEYVTAEWLNELVKTIIVNNADAARGPVLVKINDKIPQYITSWFKREIYPNNFQLKSFSTGNLILRRISLQKFEVWFDNRFNLTGGEDSYFGTQLLKKGARIFWSANAIVYETIPKNRASIKWLIKRTFRGASGFTFKLKLEREYLKLARKLIISFLYIIFGICGVILIILPIDKRYWGIFKLTEGVGGFAGLVNIVYKEYK